jgi:methylmalonyl-CoA/ethylmalonyl-CoA epimerase
MDTTGGEIGRALGLPNASQVCVAVRDLARAIAYCERTLGLGPFVTPEIRYDEQIYLGRPIPDSRWIMGFASLGPIELELSQPVSGPSIYRDFIEEHGEGLHHIGFDVGSLDEKLERCSKLGIRVLSMGRTPAGGFAHLDTTAEGGPLIELIQRKARRA